MSFTQVPSGIKKPGFYTEFNNSRAASGGSMPWKVLIIGQQTKSASGVQVVESADAADAKYGYGSQLALMIRSFLKNGSNIELYALPIAEPASGAAATCEITVTASSVKAGTLALYIGGERVAVPVAKDATANDIASAIASAVGTVSDSTSKTSLVCSASASNAVVTLTAKNKGVVGNGIDVRVNYNSADVTPEGVSLSIGGFSGGTGDVSLSGVPALIANRWFNEIVAGCNDDTNVGVINNELDSRWNALRQETGVLFYGKDFVDSGDTTAYAAALTYYDAKNSQVLVPVSYIKSPTPCFVTAAALAGAAAVSAKNDPAAPIKSIELKGVLAPKSEDELTFDQQDTLLKYGCSNIACDEASRTVYICRAVTTYKRNAAGAADDSYSQPETVFCLSYFRWKWNNHMATKYPAAKLAKDGSAFGVGQVILTPTTAKAEAVEFFGELIYEGVCQDMETFKNELEVEIDANDSWRINFMLPPDFVKQLFICATEVQFK